ncbi:MAG: hypothetical protein AUG44_21845 [Actinobacteria bacterium 13_1_20CM_3_71_11]|nr:MAG: hypothetical protein AUG44_21845 [Actinobacteria bacterium 13_1_20CM_3_71_11]
MKNGSDNLNNAPVSADDRFAGQLGYRAGARRDPGGIVGDPTGDLTPRNGTSSLGSVLDEPVPSMSLHDLDSLAEPSYPPPGWLDSPTGTLADHPLLRGLLMELPPKGAMPPADWLDRWFEAARSILELLYQQHGPTGLNHR